MNEMLILVISIWLFNSCKYILKILEILKLSYLTQVFKFHRKTGRKIKFSLNLILYFYVDLPT